MIAVTESAGYWLTLLLTAAPLYLTYKMYQAGRESEARSRRKAPSDLPAIASTMRPRISVEKPYSHTVPG